MPKTLSAAPTSGHDFQRRLARKARIYAALRPSSAAYEAAAVRLLGSERRYIERASTEPLAFVLHVETCDHIWKLAEADGLDRDELLAAIERERAAVRP